MVAKFEFSTQFQRKNASLDTAFMVAEFKEISWQDKLYTQVSIVTKSMTCIFMYSDSYAMSIPVHEQQPASNLTLNTLKT